MAIGELQLPIQSGGISGSGITLPARIERAGLVWKVLFAADQTEQIIHQFEAPINYASAPVWRKKWGMTSDTNSSHTVDLETEVMAIADGEDYDVASFDAVNESTPTIPASTTTKKTTSQTLTNNDSMAPEETILIRDSRDHDGTDDATGDHEQIANVFSYTTT